MMKKTRFTLLLFILAGLFFSVQLIQIAIGQTNNSGGGPKVIVLDKVGPSDVIGNRYGPVLFRHKYHAGIVKDCSVCHHFFSEHSNDQVVPGDKCDKCHASANFESMSKELPCDTCHNTASAPTPRVVTSSEGSMLTIPGLKAAYHRNCLECHQNMGGPQGCGECHLANVPDHTELVGKYDGSGTCEECHPGKVKEVQKSTHYRLNQPYALGFLHDEKKPSDVGMLNRYGRLWGTDAVTSWDAKFAGACKTCHIGYGLIPYTSGEKKIFAESEFGNVDCLICHYKGDYSTANPDRASRNFANLISYAKKVEHTSSDACKRCHTALSSNMDAVSPEYSGLRGTPFEQGKDVHANFGMSCFDCHYEQAHRFQRQVSPSVQAADSPRNEQSCSKCHRDAHTSDKYAKMVPFMACTGCHIPDRGGMIEVNLEGRGTPTVLKSRIVYKWFNRTTDLLGKPYGDKSNGMLFPYRVAIIREPIDSEGKILNVDPVSGLVIGTVASWREREIYLSMSHGVSLDSAYKCPDCHSATSKFTWSGMGLNPPLFNM
jgi:hypothetical protein